MNVEEKADALGQILEEREKKPDGFTAEVEKQIDRLIGKVSAKMEEIEVSMKEDVADGKRLNEEKAKELKDSLCADRRTADHGKNRNLRESTYRKCKNATEIFRICSAAWMNAWTSLPLWKAECTRSVFFPDGNDTWNRESGGVTFWSCWLVWA